MIQEADVREWRNHNVVDPTRGHKIGVLEAIYADTTDEPAMATVRTVARKNAGAICSGATLAQGGLIRPVRIEDSDDPLRQARRDPAGDR